MEEQSNDAIQQFIAITSASKPTAQFFLESAKGDIASAVDQYFTAGASEVSIDRAMPTAQELPAVGSSAQKQETEEAIAPPRASRVPNKKPADKIKGFGDLKAESDGDEDESNEYYTGGEKSGMVVKGGKGNKANDEGQVDAYFDKLEKAGARRGQPEDLDMDENTQSQAFTGRVRRLGDASEEISARSSGRVEPEAAGPQAHTITFWRNNVFTVNQGEPRDMNDPANRSFLEAISRGEAPQELLTHGPHRDIKVNCVRNNSDYVAPAKSIAFTGRGQTLAGPSGQKGDSRDSKSRNPSVASREWQGVDASQPITSLQLRLADGSRMVAQFNHEHTVADIRRFIAASRPDMGSNYGLMTAFPSAKIEDDETTLSKAGLLNAVVIQKME